MDGFQELEFPQIDDRPESELVEQSKLRVYNESQGLINDFTENSPVTALLEGLCFAGSELLWRVNKLAPALAIAFYRNAGVYQSQGTKSLVRLTFTLKNTTGSPYNVPANTEVRDRSNSLSFFTTNVLTIPPQNIFGEVNAIAQEPGVKYNVGQYTVNTLIQPLANIDSVTNVEPATGGTNAETDAEAIARGNKAIRRRGLVTAKDYEQAAEELLGTGSRAKAIPLLSGNRVSYEAGAVHLFLLNPGGGIPSDALVADIQSKLVDNVHIGTNLYVSPAQLKPVEAEIICVVFPRADYQALAESLWEAYKNYVNPLQIDLGEVLILNEVVFALRNVASIRRIEYLTLNSDVLNIPMPNNYTVPYAKSLYVQLLMENGEQVYQGNFSN